MIIANKNTVTIQDVTAPQLLSEFTGIIEAVYETLIKEGYDDDFARENIAQAGRFAFMTDEEIHDLAKEAEAKLIKLMGAEDDEG